MLVSLWMQAAPPERLSLAEAILKGSWHLRASACWQHSQQMVSQSFIPEGVSGQRAGVSSADLHGCIRPFGLSTLSTLASSPSLDSLSRFVSTIQSVLRDLEEDGRKRGKAKCHHPILLWGLSFSWHSPGVKDPWRLQFFLT